MQSDNQLFHSFYNLNELAGLFYVGRFAIHFLQSQSKKSTFALKLQERIATPFTDTIMSLQKKLSHTRNLTEGDKCDEQQNHSMS